MLSEQPIGPGSNILVVHFGRALHPCRALHPSAVMGNVVQVEPSSLGALMMTCTYTLVMACNCALVFSFSFFNQSALGPAQTAQSALPSSIGLSAIALCLRGHSM